MSAKVSAHWRDTELCDVITLQRGFDLPADERKPGSVPIVSSSGIFGTHSDARIKDTAVNRAVAGFPVFKNWSSEAIEKRQVALATLAQKVWDIPKPKGKRADADKTV